MNRVAAVALGSNLRSQWGEPAENLREAIARLRVLGAVRAISRFYETAPVGYTDQPDFTNGAVLLETAMEPAELMRALLRVEREMGRDRTAPAPAKGPRIIDLDLLLMDEEVMAGPELTLPHPALAERRFVLEPLAEIAPGMREPVTGKTAAQMLAELAVVAAGRVTER